MGLLNINRQENKRITGESLTPGLTVTTASMSGLGNTGLGSTFIQRLTREQNKREDMYIIGIACYSHKREKGVADRQGVTDSLHYFKVLVLSEIQGFWGIC